MGATDSDRAWLDKGAWGRTSQMPQSPEKLQKQENGVGDHSYQLKEKFSFSIAQSCQLGVHQQVHWDETGHWKLLSKSIYGLFRQRDFYILAQASNLILCLTADQSHRLFLGSETDPLCGCLRPGSYLGPTQWKHALITSSEEPTGVRQLPGSQWAGSTGSSVWDWLGHPVTQARGLGFRTVKGESDKGG